jgi:hypothetical protein
MGGFAVEVVQIKCPPTWPCLAQQVGIQEMQGSKISFMHDDDLAIHLQLLSHVPVVVLRGQGVEVPCVLITFFDCQELACAFSAP